MNLILLEPDEIHADGTAVLSGKRARHVREVLKAAPGEEIRVGVVDGPMGTATVLEDAQATAPALRAFRRDSAGTARGFAAGDAAAQGDEPPLARAGRRWAWGAS